MSSHIADSLSNDAAVELLFQLTASGEHSTELVQVDALVYERLLRTYEADDVPTLQNLVEAA